MEFRLLNMFEGESSLTSGPDPLRWLLLTMLMLLMLSGWSAKRLRFVSRLTVSERFRSALRFGVDRKRLELD